MIPALVPASWRARTLAGLIDTGIVAAYIVVLGMLIAIVFPLMTGPTPLWAAIGLAWLFIEVPIGVWWWRQESAMGTTIGKRLEGLRVVHVGTPRRPSALRAAVRVTAKLVPWAVIHALILVAADPGAAGSWWWSVPLLALVAALTVVGILAGYARIDRRAAYDLLAGTQVVEVG